MTEIRILRRCFAYTAFVFALVFLATLPALIEAPFPHATSRFHADPIGLVLILMREMILFMPPALALVNGVAWWTVKHGRSSARRWAMASSSLFLLFSVPFFVADIVILQYAIATTAGALGVFLSSLVFSGLGVTGLAYFTRCEALAPTQIAVHHV